MLVLVIGDLFIPQRTPDLDSKFKKLLVPGKIQHILTTGNLGSAAILEYLSSVCPNITSVAGCWDAGIAKESLSIKLGGFNFGLVAGHDLVPYDNNTLLAVAQRLGVDVLVSGYNCHFQAVEHFGKFLINPGSATGMDHPSFDCTDASFVLMDVHETNMTLYIYRLVNDQVKVEKVEYSKPASPS